MTEQKRRRFFRPQFTLATLLIVFTIIAPLLAYIASVRFANERRKKAFDAITSKGGQFQYVVSGPVKADPKPSSLQKLWSSITADPKLPPFSEVHIYHALDLADEDLRSLALLSELESFHMVESDKVTDEGLSQLTRLPNLKDIQLAAVTRVEGTFLRKFSDHSTLESLRLTFLEKLQGENLEALGRLTKLKVLELTSLPTLTDGALRKVNLPSTVTYLNLGPVKAGDETLARWLSQVKLEQLTLHAPITRKVAPSLAAQTDLQILSITNAPLRDEDFAFLAGYQKLYALTLSGMPIRGDVLDYLQTPQKITALDLSNSLFTDQNLVKLERFQKLRQLNLAWTPLTGEGLEAQAAWPKPDHFQLAGTRFTERGKQAISKYPKLKWVTLPSNYSPNDYKQFSKANQPKNPMFNSFFAGPNGGGGPGQMFSPAMLQAKLDNCPADLMKPVADLQELGVAEQNDQRNRERRGQQK